MNFPLFAQNNSLETTPKLIKVNLNELLNGNDKTDKLENNVKKIEITEDTKSNLHNMSIKQLKDLAKTYKLKTTGTKNEPSLTFFSVTYDSVYNSTNYLVTLNKFGKQIAKTKMPKINSGMGLNYLTLDNLFIVQRDSLLEVNNQGQYKAYSRTNFYPTIDYLGKHVIEERNGYESLISNRAFSYKGDSNCVIILNQQDPANHTSGFIEIYSLTAHKVIERFSFLTTGARVRGELIICAYDFTRCCEKDEPVASAEISTVDAGVETNI